MKSLPLSSIAVLGAFAVCASLGAQQAPPKFMELKLPAPVQGSSLTQLGKMIAYQTAKVLHVYSSFRREWAALSIGATAQVRQANDWVLVRDGLQFTAIASYRGRFESLTVTNAASVLNPPSHRNDSLLLVQDAGRIHVFSGFTGAWTSLAVGAGYKFEVERDAAVIFDGKDLFGVSAYDGRFVKQVVPGSVKSLEAEGSFVSAEDSSKIYAFSAQTRQWTTAQKLTGTVSRVFDKNLGLWSSGPQTLAYSGHRGRFSLRVTGVPKRVIAEDSLAIVESSGGYSLYSAVTGDWLPLFAAPVQSIHAAECCALLVELGKVHAFSAARGTRKTIVAAAAQTGVSQAVAAIVEKSSGRVQLYSALTGNWVRAPSGTSQSMPQLALQSALLKTSTGYLAFDARRDRFVPLAASSAAIAHANSRSSVFAVEDKQKLSIYDARRGRWISAPLSSQLATRVQIWRTTLIAENGRTVFGFGAQDGQLTTVLASGNIQQSNASSEVGHCRLANSLLAYSPLSDLTTISQFPEFRRLYSLGTKQTFCTRAAASGAHVLLLGLGAPSIQVPVLGSFEIDLRTLIVGPAMLTGKEGWARTEVPLPRLPGLLGLEFFAQNLVLPPKGTAYLSGLASFLAY